jgi:putative DNA-invertase from lambdoid prophage Rac
MFRSALDALDVLGRLKRRGVSLHMIDLGGDVTGTAGLHDPVGRRGS